MKDYITTFTKIHFNPLEPNAEDICIQDIAHALSMMTRANGHFPEFYSIAQHSIHCAQEAVARNFTNRTVLACLLHDASEAYLSDITRPVKRRMLKYKQYESCLLYTSEFLFLVFGYNINKLHAKIQHDRLKCQLHPLKESA